MSMSFLNLQRMRTQRDGHLAQVDKLIGQFIGMTNCSHPMSQDEDRRANQTTDSKKEEQNKDSTD